MTTATENNSGMPSTMELVRETLGTFATAKTGSSVLGFDQVTLESIGLLLVDPQQPDSAGLDLLIEEHGKDAVSRSAYYRFALEFRERFDGVRQIHRQRVLKIREAITAACSAGGAGHTDSLAKVLIHQTMQLASERIIDADDLGQLEGRELGAVIALIDGWSKSQFKREEIDLKISDAQQRAEKLQAELALKQQQLSKLPERVVQLEARLKQLQTAINTGKKIDPAIFAEMQAQLVALRHVAPEEVAA